MSTHTPLRVNLGPRSYDIVLTHQGRDRLAGFLGQCSRGRLALIVADENVASVAREIRDLLVDQGWQPELALLPPGESQKSLTTASQLYDRLIDLPADRRTLVIAVGGGVMGDLAGFVAATYARGLPLFMIPTTLLAMVDSSVGGKVAVNHPRAKNMIGVFHQPVGVWIDTAYLDSLPEREYRSGLAEVVKYGVILDPVFFSFLEENAGRVLNRDPETVAHLVHRSCQLKAQVVEQDEREETGLRAILNYGHTFAHAFETAGGYGHWLHGEAVAAGMISASRLAEALGMIPSSVTERQLRLLEAFSLPTRTPSWEEGLLLETMRADKKSVAGKMRFILPTRIGHVEMRQDVPEELVGTVLQLSRMAP